MTLKLVVTTNVDGDVFELILTKSKYRVGRRDDNDLRIKETYVSAHHSELNRTTEGTYELTDCGSSNGTYLNGIKVEKAVVIKAGDFIKFGILKVAVKKHEDEGPTIVSLKDRAVFAKKRNGDVSSGPQSDETGRADSADSSDIRSTTKNIPSLEKDTSATPTSGESKAPTMPEGELARKGETKSSTDKDIKSTAVSIAELGETNEAQRKEIKSLQTEHEQAFATIREELDKEKEASKDLLKKVTLLESSQSLEQKSAQATQTQLEEALSAKSSELTAISNQLSELKGSLAEKEEHLSRAASEIAELNSASESAALLESELLEFKKKIATLSEEKSTLQSLVESKEKESANEHQLLQETIEKLQNANTEEAATVAGSVALLKNRLSESSNLADTLTTEKAELLNTLREAEENGLQLTEKLNEAEGFLQETESQKENLQERLHETSKSNGELQARLDRESAEVAQLGEELESAKISVIGLRSELEAKERELEKKETEFLEQEKKFTRYESELILQLKRELGEAQCAQKKLEENEERLLREKRSLNNGFDKLKEQADTLETENSKLIDRERILAHEKEELASQLEKAKTIHSELAGKIKEEQTNAIAQQVLVSKLEAQLTENESESVRREQERIAEVQAGLGRREKEHEADLQKLEKLAQKFEQLQKRKSVAETNLQTLRDENLRLESERDSASKILQETERERSKLSSALEDKNQIAASYEITIAEKTASITALKTQQKQTEAELISQHREECENLQNEILAEKSVREKRETELQNTRAGMSEALRKSWERTEEERSRLLADGNSQLSEVEAELGRVIHTREEIEAARDSLEDELNEREERLEKMSEELEDLQIQIKDQTEQRDLLISRLEKTRTGLSSALHSSRLSLEETRALHREEKDSSEALRSEVEKARAQVSLLENDLAELRGIHADEIKNWESRYDVLREEKATLACEDSNLNRIREQIRDAQAERRTIEAKLKKLRAGEESSNRKLETLQEQQESLLKEREELKAELNAARKELETTQKRQLQSEQKREKLADSISSSEKRISSLQKLESEIEGVVERKRKKGIVSRSEIFTTPNAEFPASNSEFSREDFYRKLINKLDLIDDLSKRYENRWRYPRVAEQLTLLKSSFLDFLHDHSVKEFNLEPGTVLSLEERKRIKLVPQQESESKKPTPVPSRTNGQRSKVVTTIRPGYVYKDGGRDVIIRKAEVIVA